MKSLLIATMTMAAFIIPAAAFAATFDYVNTAGNIAAISANSPAEALNASDIAPASGVMLAAGNTTMTGFVSVSSGPLQVYTYINVNGYSSQVTAASAAQALTVGDIAPGSGVMLFTH